MRLILALAVHYKPHSVRRSDSASSCLSDLGNWGVVSLGEVGAPLSVRAVYMFFMSFLCKTDGGFSSSSRL